MNIGIIGGGASGLACGIFLARRGYRVTIFERKERVGKKLLATGNGRCNVTNVDLSLYHFHSVEGKVFSDILDRFALKETKEFFRSLGIDLVEEARGKIYPVTLTANTVLNAMRMELLNLGVQEVVEKKIDDIFATKEGFILKSNGEQFHVDKVILATGGRTMPKSGSDGNGYKLAEKLGHRRSENFPAICAIQIDSPYLKHLAGTKVVGEIGLYRQRDKLSSAHGEILIAKDGISGPPVLDLARHVHASPGIKTVRFPLINHLDQMRGGYFEELESRSYLDRSIEAYLQGVVSKKWVHVVCKEIGMDPKSSVLDLDYERRIRMLNLLFEIEMKVVGTRDYDSAQVTCGGLLNSQFNTETLESNLVPGFYAIGEVLDMDGDCGGYNLQWAWASANACAGGIDK